ncbi:protein JINGUBANG [Hordeum vulgare subsp. vulgare]|uniref:protein JINGUBANG n=1 Tax=Hordeum vulgare subsp. vulgare TaxID=112509 RepID=UPI000B4841EC|nr:protein JINGUBANG [Hordeum vulgare subsp. vulgare]
MAIMPPEQQRAAMSEPLLPYPASLPSSASSSFSASASFPSFSASSSPSDAAPVPIPARGEPLAACKPLAVLRDAHSRGGGSVSCLSLCGEFLLSASTGSDIVAWQLPDLRLFARFGGHGCGEGAVKALAAAGGRVFSAHQDGRVRVWRVSRSSENAFKLVAALPTTRDYLGRVFRQASYVQAGPRRGRRRGRRLWIEHADSISCLAVAAQDGVVYSGSWDRTLKVWRMSDLRCLESVRAHDDAINAVAADCGVVYSASADGRVKAWERGKVGAGTHTLLAVLVARDGVSWNAVAASGDAGAAGRRVYAAGSDGHVLGWDRHGGRWNLACNVKAHAMAVLCMCVAGDLVCTGSADKTIGLWRRQPCGGLAKVGAVGGHEGPVKCIQASLCRASNGYMVYSGGLDKSIRVWWVPNADNGDERPRETGAKDHRPCVLLG